MYYYKFLNDDNRVLYVEAQENRLLKLKSNMYEITEDEYYSILESFDKVETNIDETDENEEEFDKISPVEFMEMIEGVL